MKKNILYSFAVMAGMTLASCNGEYDDWADPQAYGPEEAAAKYGLTITNGPEANVTMPDDDGIINLVQLSASSDNVVGYTVNSLTINGEAVEASTSGNYVQVDANTLLKLVEKQYNSRAAVARTLDVKTSVTLNLANGDAVLCEVAGETKGSLTPYATPAVDAKGYYLLGDFVNQSWSLGTPIWMTDNGDGTYTATVNTKNEGSNWFKIYCGSNYSAESWDIVNAGQMGCEVNGSDALTGFVVYSGDPEYTDGVQTPTITGQGTFEVTFDANNLTYTVKRAEAMYYVVGIPNGWSTTDKSCMFYALGGNIYTYTTQWAGAWDLKIWDSKNFGDWSKTFGGGNGDGSVEGKLIPGGNGAFQAPSAGDYYTLTINMNDLTYKWSAVTPTAEYTNVSLIGGFNSWGGDVDLTQVAKAPHNWYVRATIDSDTELKFRADHDWTVSWGTSEKGFTIGDTYYGPVGSENIIVPAGTYDFYLNDITGQFCIVPVE